MADVPSSGGGKIRSRRAAASRKPYSRGSSQRKSLFSRVTDSFRTLLNPITPKWLQNRMSQEQQRASGSAQQRLEEDAVNNDDQPSTSTNHQPESFNRTNNNYKKSSPLARPPLSTTKISTSSLQYFVTPPDTPPVESNRRDAPTVGGGGGKEDLLRHLTKSSKRAKREMMESPIGSDSSYLRHEMKLLSANDNASVASSSGCSSSMQGSQRTNTSADHDGSQKPLWSSSMDSLASSKTSSSQQQITMSSHKRPRFNPTIFGIPSVNSDSDVRHSSFYNGPVQFGGTSSSGRSPYFATPYKIPAVTKVKVRHMNHQRTPTRSSLSSSRSSKSPNDDTFAAGMSSTAKKILQTLEKMSTPLNDARKIPMARTPSTYMADRQKRRTIGSSLLNASLQPPPTVGLSSPSTARLRRRSHMPLNNSLLVKKAKGRRDEQSRIDTSSTSIIVPDSKLISARGLPAPIASMSSSASMPKSKVNSSFGKEISSGGGGGGGKMKSQRRTASHYSSMQDGEEEHDAHKLPNVPLPLTSALPSFNFGKSLMTSTPTVRPPEKKSYIGSKQPEFNFASPLVKTTITQETQSSENTPKFQFSSPPDKGTSVGDEQETPKARPSSSNFTPGSKPGTPSLMFAPDPKVVSKMKENKRRSSPLAAPSNEGGFRPALKSGGVMDILGGKKKTEVTSKQTVAQDFKLPPLKQIKTGWDCAVCMVQNDNSATYCVACTTPKPNLSKTTPLSSLIKTKKGWDCDTCLVRNDVGAEKCVACETPRPGSDPAATKKLGGGLLDSFKSQSTAGFSFGIPAKKDDKSKEEKTEKSVNSFGLKFKKPEGSWDCGTCLIRNDSKSTECVACETPKPGSSQKLLSNNFNKISASDKTSEFMFGIPSKSSAACVSKSSGWGNLIKKPLATWECEVCMVRNSEERKTCEACESPKPGTKKEFVGMSFKFGENSSGLYKFGIPDTKTATTETNTPPTQNQTTSSSTGVAQSSSSTTKSTEDAPTMKKPSFNFGAPSTSPSNTPPPTFGTQPKTVAPPAYSFGATTPSEGPEQTKKVTESVPATGLFKFGAQKSEEPKTAETSKPPMFSAPKQTGFVFGQPQSTAAPKTQSTEHVTTTANSNPLLGATPASSQISTPAFGTNINTQQQFTVPKTGLQPPFGGGGFKTESLAKPEAQKTTTAPAGFSFNASKPTTGTGTYQFTGQQKSSSNPPSTCSSPFGFGSKPEQTKPTTNMFGAIQPVTASENKPGPTFGGFGPSANQTTKPAFGGFSFGAQSQTPSTTQSSGVSIGGEKLSSFGSQVPTKPSLFGAQSTNPSSFGASNQKTTSFGTPVVSGGGMFGGSKSSAFGEGMNNVAPPAFGALSSAPGFGPSASGATNVGIPKPSFAAFGSNSTNEPAQQNAPGFSGFSFAAGSGQQSSGTAAAGVGFNFGGTPNKPPPAFNPASSGVGFQFGNTTSSQSNGTYQFGAAGSNQPKQELVFGRTNAGGSSQQPPGQTGFNFGAAGSTSSGFNFSGSQPPASQSAFGAGAAPPNQNPFNATPSTTTPTQRGGRVVRQARRRLRK